MCSPLREARSLGAGGHAGAVVLLGQRRREPHGVEGAGLARRRRHAGLQLHRLHRQVARQVLRHAERLRGVAGAAQQHARSCPARAALTIACAIARSRAIWMRVIGPICDSGSRSQWPLRTASCCALCAVLAELHVERHVGHRVLHAFARQVGADHRHARAHRGHHGRAVGAPGPALARSSSARPAPALRSRRAQGRPCCCLPRPSRAPARPGGRVRPASRPSRARSPGVRRRRAVRPAAAHRPAAAPSRVGRPAHPRTARRRCNRRARAAMSKDGVKRRRNSIGPYYATAGAARRRPFPSSPVRVPPLLGPRSRHALACTRGGRPLPRPAYAAALDDRPAAGGVAGLDRRRAHRQPHAAAQRRAVGDRRRAGALLHAAGGRAGRRRVVGHRAGHRLGAGAGLGFRLLAAALACRSDAACTGAFHESHDLLRRRDRRRVRDDAAGRTRRRAHRSGRRRAQPAAGAGDDRDPVRHAMERAARAGDQPARRARGALGRPRAACAGHRPRRGHHAARGAHQPLVHRAAAGVDGIHHGRPAAVGGAGCGCPMRRSW